MHEHPEIHLVPPPRRVPLLLRGALLFGGFLSQFGWLFAGFGMIFVWMFGIRTDPAEPFHFIGELETAKGQIVEREETVVRREGRHGRKGRSIVAHHYGFLVDGTQYDGTSYSTNKRAVGAPVTVEFPAGNPQRSRIEGMRTALAPPWMLFTLLFPLFGIGALTPGLRKGWKAGSLLRWGKPAFGRLKEKQPTGMSINDRQVFKLTFEFTDDLGERHEAIATTHRTRLLEDDERELLLYEPANPKNSTLIDHLHGTPYVDERGRIRVGDVRESLLVLVIPLVTIIGHFVYIWLGFPA